MRLVERIRSVRSRSRRRIAVIIGGAVIVWFAFFDSHSLYKRIAWHQESTQLEAENAQLQAEIDRLQKELDRELSDEEIERIAREQYGMRKEGETVYPVRPDD